MKTQLTEANTIIEELRAKLNILENDMVADMETEFSKTDVVCLFFDIENRDVSIKNGMRQARDQASIKKCPDLDITDETRLLVDFTWAEFLAR